MEQNYVTVSLCIYHIWRRKRSNLHSYSAGAHMMFCMFGCQMLLCGCQSIIRESYRCYCLNYFINKFYRRLSCLGIKANSHRHTRHDTDRTVLSCPADAMNWAFDHSQQNLSLLELSTGRTAFMAREHGP